MPAPDGPGDPEPTTTTTTGTAQTPDVVGAGTELVGQGTLLQSAPGAPVELCLSAVLTSYPPRCSGPTVLGEFSWDDVPSETASGVTWSSHGSWVVGHDDGRDGEVGSFTLSRPVGAEPPDSFTPQSPEAARFPQLCEDPTADVPDADHAARTRGPEGTGEEQALQEMLSQGGLEGYVTAWVSDGGPTFNVVVTGDPDVARTRVREVFQGPLCVEQRDLPSQEDLLAAQHALHGSQVGQDLLGSGAGGVSGLLEVQVVVADEATVQAVTEAVSAWLRPDQVVIAGALQPLAADASTAPRS